MTCTKKALMVTMLTMMLGLWGCTQNGAPTSGNARLRELEAKSARLEDDYKTAATARDQARKKVALLEEQRALLTQQVEHLERIAKERDELKQLLVFRTTERDVAQNHLVQFSRDLQVLFSKVEQAAYGQANPPVITAPPAASSPAASGPQS
jgi:hypothetical protein